MLTILTTILFFPIRVLASIGDTLGPLFPLLLVLGAA